MAPGDSLARLRKALIDRAERREAPVTQLCREAGVSRSRFYELRARYRAYGEAGLRPKPRPAERPGRQVPEPLVDAIVAYAVEHPTHGQRTIALALARPALRRLAVSHGGVANVLRRAGLGRRLARLAAAESLAASEGGPLTERVLREVRAIERARTVHIGSDTPGEELFLDTFYVGHLKGVGKVWQLSAVDGASSFGIARVIAGPKTAAVMARFLVEDVLPACRAGRPAPGDRDHRQRARVRPGVRRGLRGRGRPPAPDPAPQPQPQRLRRALPGDGPPPPLPGRLPLPLLHECRGHRRRPPGVPALLQLRAPAPRLPHQGSDAGQHLLPGPARLPRADGSMRR